MIGEIILCIGIATVMTIPAWGENPNEVIRWIRGGKK